MKSKVIILIAVLVATAIRAQGVYPVPLTFTQMIFHSKIGALNCL